MSAAPPQSDGRDLPSKDPHDGDRKILRHTPEDLPIPEDLPNADVVIFDGKCVFCIGQVRNLLKLDGGERLSFMSLHDPEVTERYPDLTYDQMMEQMYVIDSAGSRYGGAAALRYLSRRLPKLWILAPLTHIPFTLPIQQWVYGQIARRRYKIANKDGRACEGGTCSIHFEDKK